MNNYPMIEMLIKSGLLVPIAFCVRCEKKVKIGVKNEIDKQIYCVCSLPSLAYKIKHKIPLKKKGNK